MRSTRLCDPQGPWADLVRCRCKGLKKLFKAFSKQPPRSIEFTHIERQTEKDIDEAYRLLDLHPARYAYGSAKSVRISELFEITSDDISLLNDKNLRTLVGLLCESEMRKPRAFTLCGDW